MTMQYLGGEEWQLTFSDKEKIVLTTQEIEEVIEEAPGMLYYQCKTTDLHTHKTKED